MNENFKLKGTDYPSFQIGRGGATVRQGTVVPTPGNPVGRPGDIYLYSDPSTTSGPNSAAYIFIGGAWSKLVNSTGAGDIGGISPGPGVFIIGTDSTGWGGFSGDDAASFLNVASYSNPTFNNLTLTGGTLLGAGMDFSLLPDTSFGTVTIGGSDSLIIVPGSILIQGTSTTVTSGTLEVADAAITVNKGGLTSTAINSGVEIEGDSGNIVGYFRSGSTPNLLEFKAPSGEELTLDITVPSTLRLTSASIGQVIKYNGTAFVNANERVGDLYDVALVGSPAIDEVLAFDGVNWYNKAINAGTGSITEIVLETNDGITNTGDGTIQYDGTFRLNLADITPDSVTTTGTISAVNFTGTSSGTNTGDQTIILSGDAVGTGTGNINVTLSATGVTAGTYNRVVVDTKGRVTSATTVATGTGSVTSVAVAGSNGIAVAGSPITNAGTIGLSLGDITPNSVTATGTVAGANLSGTNTGDQTIILSGDVSGTGTGAITVTLGTTGVTAGTYNQVVVDATGRISAGTAIPYLTANQTITLSGDVAGVGGTAITTTIGSNVVSYDKIQQASADQVLLGAQVAGDIQEITLGSNLDMAGGVLSVVGLGTLGTGTVTSVTAGNGLAGGVITNAGTIDLNIDLLGASATVGTGDTIVVGQAGVSVKATVQDIIDLVPATPYLATAIRANLGTGSSIVTIGTLPTVGSMVVAVARVVLNVGTAFVGATTVEINAGVDTVMTINESDITAEGLYIAELPMLANYAGKTLEAVFDGTPSAGEATVVVKFELI
jgi:phage tail protein X